MNVTHSVRTDQAYVVFKEIGPGEAVFTDSCCLEHLDGGSIEIDISADGRILGLEVAGASRRLPPELLNSARKIDQRSARGRLAAARR
jgi:uncharacterized protein YuzE